MLRNQKGFTLMELMIVIVIIGVLAAVGVPAYKGYTDRAKKAACDAQIKTVKTAVGMYYADEGEYPDGLTATNLGEYIENITDLITCPADSATEYTYDEDTGAVTCGSDKHKH
jgi:type II secretion system protein G